MYAVAGSAVLQNIFDVGNTRLSQLIVGFDSTGVKQLRDFRSDAFDDGQIIGPTYFFALPLLLALRFLTVFMMRAATW